MAGGIGTRFWPFSRTNNPKQFHDVLGTGKTLLQQTVQRFDDICPKENIYIVTSVDYVDLIKKQLPFLKPEQILAEPSRRNTAPCVAYACYKIAKKNPKANIIVAPADHIILQEKEFEKRINIALDAVRDNDVLLTLGIQPSRPDTGYGYIQYADTDGEVKKVKTFTEKPHLELAQIFLDSGEYVWNAGIFIWNVKTIKRAFELYLPKMAEVFDDGEHFYYTDQESAYIQKAYHVCKNISIDNGIMEKAQNVHVVLSDFGWSDLGTWKSLYEVSEKDANHNVTDGNVMLYDVKNSIVKTPQERLVVVQGLDGYIVAEYDNVLMICEKEQEQRVKDFVNEAKEKGEEFV